MLLLRVIFFYAIINQVIGRPTGFSALSDLLHKNHHQKITEYTEESSTASTTSFPMNFPADQKKSLYEEYPWLDNALSLLFDKLLRIVIVLIKKFIFKVDVTVADFF